MKVLIFGILLSASSVCFAAIGPVPTPNTGCEYSGCTANQVCVAHVDGSYCEDLGTVCAQPQGEACGNEVCTNGWICVTREGAPACEDPRN